LGVIRLVVIFFSFTNTNIDKKSWKVCLGNVKKN
jgi:hypothetical protein